MPHRIFSTTATQMKSRILLFSAAVLLPHRLVAASDAALEKEYQQMRIIALRDPRVQAAYRDADRRLDAKIVQIDPALDSYVRSKQAARENGSAPKSPQPQPPPKRTTSAAPKPVTKPAVKKSGTSLGTHVVSAGETLGAIAARHRVSVSGLRSTNQIKDERKLRVGQVLTIPTAREAVPGKETESIWSRLLN